MGQEDTTAQRPMRPCLHLPYEYATAKAGMDAKHNGSYRQVHDLLALPALKPSILGLPRSIPGASL
jgi:hypothetical protein